MTKQAHRIRDLGPSESGATRWLWRMDPPLDGHEFVISSAVVAMFTGAETYIFAASEDGEVTDWLELPGSFQGGLDHDTAIMRAGYEIVEAADQAMLRSEDETDGEDDSSDGNTEPKNATP